MNIESYLRKIIQLLYCFRKFVGESFSRDRGDHKNGPPKWHEYFLCGVRGMSEHLGSNTSTPLQSVGKNNTTFFKPINTILTVSTPHLGMKITIGGNIPPSAGLSSSSAMVCAGAICTLRANTNSDFEEIDRVISHQQCLEELLYINFLALSLKLLKFAPNAKDTSAPKVEAWTKLFVF